MPLGGHYRLDAELDPLRWMETLDRLVQLLRQRGDLLFICHDEEEARLAQVLRAPGELIFHAPSFRDYLDLLPRLHVLFANRIHAAVTAAGFGVPALLAGNDSRARIGEWIGLTVERSASLDADQVAAQLECRMQERAEESVRLRRLRQETIERYVFLMQAGWLPFAIVATRAGLRPSQAGACCNVGWLRIRMPRNGRGGWAFAPTGFSLRVAFMRRNLSAANGCAGWSRAPVYGSPRRLAEVAANYT